MSIYLLMMNALSDTHHKAHLFTPQISTGSKLGKIPVDDAANTLSVKISDQKEE